MDIAKLEAISEELIQPLRYGRHGIENIVNTEGRVIIQDILKLECIKTHEADNGALLAIGKGLLAGKYGSIYELGKTRTQIRCIRRYYKVFFISMR